MEATPRSRHVAVAMESSLYIWGGDGGDYCHTMDVFNLRKESFEGRKELAYGLAGMAVVNVGSLAYTFGGWAPLSQARCNDVYEVDLQSCSVKKLSQETAIPRRRSGSRMVLHGDTLVIFGGRTDDNRWTNEVLVFNLLTSEWKGHQLTIARGRSRQQGGQ